MGRFVGLKNADGSTKTECGIHVSGAEKTWDRVLWEVEKSSVKKVESSESALEVKQSGKASVMVVYAPWCKYSQEMEEELEKFAKESSVDVYSFRGDEVRDFVQAELNTNSFPTVNVIKSDGTAVKYDSEVRTVDAFKD